MPDPTTIAAAVSVLVLVSQIGLIAWIRWSFERLAEAAAARAEEKAVSALANHVEAQHAHPKMIELWEKRRDDRLEKVLEDLTEVIRATVIQAFNDSLRIHDENPRAHGAAAEYHHRPMNERLDRIDREVAKIRAAHNFAAEAGKHLLVRDE